jgi:hypothetical protein
METMTTHYTPDGEIDFYCLYTDAMKRIASLEALLERVKEEARKRIEEKA